MDSLTVFDKHARRVVAVLPTGSDPTGLTIDERLGRAYVALSGDDRIDVLDLLSGSRLGAIRLRPGDRPRELALAPDGRILLVASPGANAVSFVDVGSGSEIGRAPTGLDPASIVLDRAGRRAYVTNRDSSSITVLDVATRGVVATVATDAEPVRARLDRAERRLYVAHARSPYLSSLSLPDLAPSRRIFVGGGVGALEVDPRTDLVYVGRLDEDRLQVFDPLSLMPIRYVELPGPASYAVIDEVESALFVLVPRLRSVVTADLVSGRITSTLEIGRDAYQLAIAGARR
jgi:YVTN family beta-propeller protein